MFIAVWCIWKSDNRTFKFRKIPVQLYIWLYFGIMLSDYNINRPTYCMDLMLATPATRAQVYIIHSWEVILLIVALEELLVYTKTTFASIFTPFTFCFQFHL